MENSAHTWRLKIFKLVFVYAHRLFCYPPAKIFFLSPQSSGSRTGGYLLSSPTLCKRWRVDFLSPPPFFSIFPIPTALAAHRYSWTPMAIKYTIVLRIFIFYFNEICLRIILLVLTYCTCHFRTQL